MKPIEQQLQREADDGYPGPNSWQVSKVSSGSISDAMNGVQKALTEVYGERTTNEISRVEVICMGKGRDYVNMNTGKVELSYQDDGRTLKVFVEKMRNKVSSGDMEKEIVKVEELYRELGSVLFRVTDYSAYIHLKEGLGQFRNIAIEAIKQKYQR